VSDDELVLVVPRRAVMDALGTPDGWLGVRPDGMDAVAATIREAGEFRRRGDVEPDPTWKQVIPYPVLRDGERTFLMRRTRAGGDARLHDRYTIGVGGHVNPEDGALDGDLEAAMRREFAEELAFDFKPSFAFVGLLNDDGNAVGAVHLGVVYVADASGRPVAVRETEKLSGRFATRDELTAVVDEMETWSRLAFEAMETSPALR
jgi:predicted NUDIX family phosphoesterase